MLENKKKNNNDQSESPLVLAWKRFIRHRLAQVSMIFLVILVLSAVLAPFITHLLGISYDDTSAAAYLPSSSQHLLGTDKEGRDVLARLLYGGRGSLTVGLISAVMSALIGTIVGALAGYYGGWIDNILMRFTDAMLSLPVLPLMIVLSAIQLDKLLPFLPPEMTKGGDASIFKLIIIVVFFGWMTVARLVRGDALSLREREFVLAAKAIGVSQKNIIFRHVVPNCIAPIIVASTLAVGSIILYEAVLSFLGLGIQPPTPSWGNMLFQAQEYMRQAPILAFYPGRLILITTVSFSFLGAGLRDACAPRFVMGKK